MIREPLVTGRGSGFPVGDCIELGLEVFFSAGRGAQSYGPILDESQGETLLKILSKYLQNTLKFSILNPISLVSEPIKVSEFPKGCSKMSYSNKPCSLKYMKRAGIYMGSNYNVTFDPKTRKAVSYKWWTFVAEVEGKLVFNDYRYSVSTSKQQSKVRSLLNELNIKIDISMPLPKGINTSNTLAELILESEEFLCDQIGEQVLKQQARNDKARARKFAKKLENYLENQVHFRDYKIESSSRFGKINEVAVHQCVSDIERDVENALYNFHRDGFGSVVFYVEGL